MSLDPTHDEADNNASDVFVAKNQVSWADAHGINMLFGRHPNSPIPDMDALDGFLTALVCSPRVVTFQDILKLLTYGEGKGKEVTFKDELEANLLLKVTKERLTSIHHILSDNKRTYEPHITNEEKPGHHWAKGYFNCITLLRESWEQCVKDDDHLVLVNIIAYLATEGTEQVEKYGFNPDLVKEHRGELLSFIPELVQHLFDFFTEERTKHGHTYPKYFSEINIRTGSVPKSGRIPGKDTMVKGRRGPKKGGKRRW